MSEYEQYVTEEWDLFFRDPSRNQASLDASAEIRVDRVLDVGCGAGQELTPFLVHRGAFGVGLDAAQDSGRAGRRLYDQFSPGAQVTFIRGLAENIPFRSGSFDVVICRLALPYVDNRCALSEMARVLRPGGVLLLKIHHARYYMGEIWRAALSGRGRSMIHNAMVLVSGALYHLLRIQPGLPLVGRETFQTALMLRGELARYGLSIRRTMPDSDSAAPSFLVVKELGAPVTAPTRASSPT